jgi:hypothetical protein
MSGYSKTMPVKQKFVNSTGVFWESICNMTFWIPASEAGAVPPVVQH